MKPSLSRPAPSKGARDARRPEKKAAKPAFSFTQRIDQIQEVLGQVLEFYAPADVVLTRWFKKHKFLGQRDRHEVAESVFDVLRHLRAYRLMAQSGQGNQNRLMGILGLLNVSEPARVLKDLKPHEKEWYEHRLERLPETADLPASRSNLPDWLYERLSQLPQAESLMESLQQKATLDLRVNSLKADRDTLLAQLRVDHPGYQFEPTPFSPWGIRLNAKPALHKWAPFEAGALEVQDEGSQILGLLVGAKRGEMVVDFCAGAGGKTLLLGATMRSTGRLYAFDVNEHRLAKSKQRLARSGLQNVHTVVIQPKNDPRVRRLAGKVDRVLVDAPCTGMGTLRRNPDLKWRQTPKDLAELVALQQAILGHAAPLVKVGGRLVYSTCSLLPEENEQQVDRFLKAHPQFKRVPLSEVLPADCQALIQADHPDLQLRPDWHQTDGFFAAVLERVAADGSV